MTYHDESQSIGLAIYRDLPQIIYREHYSEVEDAIAREKQLKRWSRKKKVELIDRINPRWFDLFDEISGNI